MKKIFKKIHPYYIISVILIIVFIFIIPWILFKEKDRSGRLRWCRSVCPNAEVKKLEDDVCFCGNGVNYNLNTGEFYEAKNEE